MVISKSFTAVGNSAEILIKHKESIVFSVSGTFVGTVVLERSFDGGQSWETIHSKTAAASGSYQSLTPSNPDVRYRYRCSAFTSGTIVTSLTNAASYLSKKRIISAAGSAKVGAGAGFVVAAASNIALVTCPASQTAATAVVFLPQLKVGDVIEAFHLVGQIESAGGTVTVDAELRVMTAAAADVTDASVGSMTQLSATADAIMSDSNTLKQGLDKVVGADETYYILITVTTAASTDVALQAVALVVKEA
jgi:hypothetical protein